MALSDEDRAEIIGLVRREISRAGSSSGVDPGPKDRQREPGSTPMLAPSGLGLLVHSLVASVALGAFTCSLLFDVASHVAPEPYTYPRSAYWLVVVGLIASIVSAATGIFERRRLSAGAASALRGGRHATAGLVGAAGYLLAFVLRRATDFLGEVPPVIVVISAVSLAVIWWAMASGFELAHRTAPGQLPSEIEDPATS